MKEKLVIEIISKCINFLDVNQLSQLRLVLESELHKYNFQLESTYLVPSDQYQSKIKLYLALRLTEGLSEKTLKEYNATLTRFAMAVKKDLDKVDEMDIRLYIAKRMQEGLKNSTINTMVWHIKTFYQWMCDNEYIKRNPAKLIKNVKFDKNLREALTEDEFEKLKYACKTLQEQAIVSVFYSTASRVSEIQQLNKDDIDWYSDTIKVLGKGKKTRLVYLNSNSKLYLTKYFELRTDNNPALFVGCKKPHNRLTVRGIEDIFTRIGKRAGIRDNVCPHKIRHGSACTLLNNGATLTEVQDYLGHESPSTTMIYARMNKEDVKRSVKKHLH